MIILDPSYSPAEDRYDSMPYRRCGTSGLLFPAISLGLWRNSATPSRSTCRGRSMPRVRSRITHFDFANNYGNRLERLRRIRAGSQEATLAPIGTSSRSPRKPAGTCGPVPTATGVRGSISLPASTRASSEWVSSTSTCSIRIASTPSRICGRQWGPSIPPYARGKHSTSGSSYSAQQSAMALAILEELGTPLLVHQPSYSMLNRWIEDECCLRSAHTASAASGLSARPGHVDRQVPRRRS